MQTDRNRIAKIATNNKEINDTLSDLSNSRKLKQFEEDYVSQLKEVYTNFENKVKTDIIKAKESNSIGEQAIIGRLPLEGRNLLTDKIMDVYGPPPNQFTKRKIELLKEKRQAEYLKHESIADDIAKFENEVKLKKEVSKSCIDYIASLPEDYNPFDCLGDN